MNENRKSKRHIPRYVALPLIFIVSLVISLIITDRVFVFILGDDFAPNIRRPDLELGTAQIPTAEALQISYCPLGNNGPAGWIKNRYHVRINSMGFRSAGVSFDDRNKTRVICLGDSCTFGWGEEEKDIYPSVLERDLSESLPTRVYNTGVAAYSSAQGLVQFRKVKNILAPDVVTISFGGNDGCDVLDRPPFFALPRLPDRNLFGVSLQLGPWRKLSYLTLRYLSTRFSGSAMLSWLNNRTLINYKANLKRGQVKKSGIPRVSIDDYRGNIEGIIAEAAQRKAVSVIVVICALPEYIAAAQEVAQKTQTPLVVANQLFSGTPESFEANPEYREFVGIVKERFGEYNLRRYPGLLFTNDFCHPNPLGHKLIGDAIAEEVEKLLASSKSER